MVAITRTEGAFSVTTEGEYLPARHLVPVAERVSDFVAVAEIFLNTPYLWGGKTSLGLDCSGLVQVSLTASGVACPRNSDAQKKALGQALPLDTKLKRGDFLFWPGHVAIVRDENTIIHANGFHTRGSASADPGCESADRRRRGSNCGGVRRSLIPRLAIDHILQRFSRLEVLDLPQHVVDQRLRVRHGGVVRRDGNLRMHPQRA